MHRAAGFEPPTKSEAVKAVPRGIRRSIGTAVMLTAEAARTMLEERPDDQRGLRDRALLLIGFAGALRRTPEWSTRSDSPRLPPQQWSSAR
jgi:hypothetical protein